MAAGRDPAETRPAFVVFIKEGTTDPEELRRYSDRVGVSFEGHAVSLLAAYGAQEVLEGPMAEGVVILRFPSMAAARAWYRSPAYQNVAQHRFRGAVYRAVLVEGRPSP